MAAILALVLLALCCLWGNNALTVSEYVFPSEEVPAGLDGFRILQISDLHGKQFGKDQRRLLRRIAAEAPDLILLTGDMVDDRHWNLDSVAALVRGAAEIAPVYSITGNHELLLSRDLYDRLAETIAAAGGTLLWDERVWIGDENSGFWLLGLREQSLYDDTLSRIMPGEDALTILMAHVPQFISRYAESNVDLMLAGHAHGGLFAPGQGFFPQYIAGIYREGDTAMVMSRGLGNSVHLPRIFNVPDIVVLTLRSGKKGNEYEGNPEDGAAAAAGDDGGRRAGASGNIDG